MRLEGYRVAIPRNPLAFFLPLSALLLVLIQSGCAGYTTKDAAPSIVTQPANQTVSAGQTAIFSVSASGTAPLSYQWNKNGTAITGATSSSYTTPAETTSGSGARFTVMVSNSAGSATSSAAMLTVAAAAVPPSITTQPTSQNVIAGQTATFSAVASGTTPLSYQWRKNGTAIGGATSSSYTTPAEMTSDSGTQFTVVVSNSAGSATSGAAIVTVNGAAALAQSNPLTSDFQPSIDTNCSHSQYANDIWMTDSMQKVRQDSGSPATNACYLTVYGTQNEFVDFQVHFHDTGSGTSNLSVTVGNFVQTSPSSYTISADVRPSPNVVVYREAYVHVQSYPSNNQLDSAVPGGTNYNTYYQGALGYYPDILIPAVDPYWGQTTNAWPFTVAANQNQSAWIDVLIPSSAPSGYYLGSVTVKSGSITLATMPVILAVWQWPSAGYMPSTPTLKTELWNWTYGGLCTQMYAPGNTNNDNCANYPGSGGQSDTGVTLEWLDATLLTKDHRFAMSGQQNIYLTTGSPTQWNSYVRPLLNGTCLLHGGSGSTCPILPNSKLTVKSVDPLATYIEAVWANWQSNFGKNGWGTAGNLPLFDYLTDEPHGTTAFQTLVTNAATRHGFLTPGIPELVTTDIYWGQGSQSAANTFSTTVCSSTTCILNSIDILVPAINILEPIGGPIQPLSTYRTWLAGSTDSIPRHWWSYQACSSAGTCTDRNPGPGPSGYAYTTWPNYNVDGKPAAHRAMEWITFMHGQTGELYYAADVCAAYDVETSDYAGCVPSGNSANYDPWDGIYYAGGWGDGTLVYAGGVASGAINYMGSGVTIPLILPSVRLKDIRDGVQDYEYLNVLTNYGQSSLVQTQIASWITNSYTFETSGSGLQAARQALGTAIHQITYPVGNAP